MLIWLSLAKASSNKLRCSICNNFGTAGVDLTLSAIEPIVLYVFLDQSGDAS